jgi:hypothetical protein
MSTTNRTHTCGVHVCAHCSCMCSCTACCVYGSPFTAEWNEDESCPASGRNQRLGSTAGCERNACVSPRVLMSRAATGILLSAESRCASSTRVVCTRDPHSLTVSLGPNPRHTVYFDSSSNRAACCFDVTLVMQGAWLLVACMPTHVVTHCRPRRHSAKMPMHGCRGWATNPGPFQDDPGISVHAKLSSGAATYLSRAVCLAGSCSRSAAVVGAGS